jgi:hypothetical protein
MTATTGAQASTNAYVEVCQLDAQAGSAVKFGANCRTAGVTWEVFGSNVSNFAVETSVHGPVALTVLDPDDTYITAAPAYRYYRAKIKSTTVGVPGLAFVTGVALGFVYGGTVSAFVSPTQVRVTPAPGATRDACYAVCGTDDTAAIQAAIDYAYSRVVSGSADGGVNLHAPLGNYLFSSPINHKPSVTVCGAHGGATIFYADGEAMTASVPQWNMTGTFAVTPRIAFFTRLEDVRIDCGHVPGSVGIFCDALQENSGLKRVTVMQYLQYGIQAGSSTDRYGCTNWMIEDAWVYPSTAAFADDTVSALHLEYATYTTLIRGTYLGQAGFMCGYGKGIDAQQGTVQALGQLHFESARVGFHFNTGSGGLLTGCDTQSFVRTAVLIEGGNPTIVSSVLSAGKYSVSYPYQNVLLTDSFVPAFYAGTVAQPAQFSLPIQMAADPSQPNLVTWNPLNFGTEYQGGWFSVNSRADGYPNWVKTSLNASTKAMFMRMAARAFEIRIGNATNAQGTDPGSSYFLVDDVVGGVKTPRVYFADAAELGWGNSADINRFRWTHRGTNQRHMILQQSGDSGATWADVIDVDRVAGTVTITGLVGTGVTSVGMTVPGFLSVSGSPVTSSGTLAVSLANQSANRVFAGPSSGGAAAPTFRQLVDDDLAATAWTAYTPTITPTSGTATTTTLTAASLQQGKKVFYRIYWLGTISIASADMAVSIPVAPISTAAAPLGQAANAFVRVGGSLVGAHAAVFTSPQAIIFGCPGTTFPAGGTSVELCATGVYEAA